MLDFLTFNFFYEFFQLTAVVFIFAIFAIVFKAINYIQILVYLEIMVLAINLNFICFSFILDDIVGQIFSIFILAVVASESAIALAILVLYYRVYQNISIYSC
jgi:NADH-quinone oxidoreductase subunit K